MTKNLTEPYADRTSNILARTQMTLEEVECQSSKRPPIPRRTPLGFSTRKEEPITEPGPLDLNKFLC